MQDWLLSYAFYVITALFLIGIPFLYIRRMRHRSARTREEYVRTRRLGLSEPITLHPVINENQCIGTEACVDTCPEGEILGIIDGKATLVSPTRCIGHGACAAACPVQAITLVFGTEQRGVDIPALDSRFETSVGGIYVAGELGGMGLIRNAVTQGWEAVNYIHESIGKRGGNGYDLAIAGAGPAGLSAALKAKELGLSFLCLEQEDIGGTILTYPRRKLVMTQPMDIPLYGQVKKREMFKEELLDLWNEIVDREGLKIHVREKLEEIAREAGDFRITTSREEYRARRILLAIGRRGTPRKLDVPGEKSSKVAYRLIEPEQYANSRVLVVGGGDSALEAAISVSEYSRGNVILSCRGSVFSRVKDANRILFEEHVKEGSIHSLLESSVREIREKEVVLEQGGETITLENDYVLILIGGILPTGFLQKLGIQVATKFGEA